MVIGQLVSVSTPSPSWSSPIALTSSGKQLQGHLMLYNTHATAIVEYSYDGSTLVGQLDPSNGTVGKTFDDIELGSIYFRIKSGSTGPAVVSVEAWS
jgi:hypothetical protein